MAAGGWRRWRGGLRRWRRCSGSPRRTCGCWNGSGGSCKDASHELGTPITVALGHAELIERAAADPVIVADARVVADELGRRLRRLAGRMLLLASAGSADFLHLAPVEVEPLLVDALGRWGRTRRRWTLGAVDEATVLADHDRLALALDALIENAVAHTDVDGRIAVSA